MRKFTISLFAAACVFSLVLTGCGKKEEVKIKVGDKEVKVSDIEKATEQEAVIGSSIKPKEGEVKEFNVYIDKSYFKNHFAPSGWMGDFSDIKINDAWKENPHSRQSCIKITYTGAGSQGAGWAGIYWQNPPNNWGEKKGGFDLTGAKKLTFWARGDKGGEVITEFKLGGVVGTYSDTDSIAVGPIKLTPEWKEFTINLSGADLTYISGGFCFVASKMDNPNGLTFYLDDIKYEY